MKAYSFLSLFMLFASSACALNTDKSSSLRKRAAAVDQQVGFSTLNGGTKGGKGGSTTTVSSLSALRKAVQGDKAKIVYINGIIKGDGQNIEVGSYTSILGKGSNSGVTNSGFLVKRAKNVIFRNLKLSKAPAPMDLIGIEESTNVWVDHNDFESSLKVDKDFYDGQVDAKRQSDFITISWNKFHDSWKTSLIGHSEKYTADKGHLRVTYHHNWFTNVNSRLPSLRFGTGHLYSNYYKDVKGSAINSREGAQTLIENNYFDNVKNPIETDLYDGYAVQRGNVFVSSDKPDTGNVGSFNKAPYSYTLDAAQDVPSIVVTHAGVGKVSV